MSEDERTHTALVDCIEVSWADLRRALLQDRGYNGAIEFLEFALELMKREKVLADRRTGENVVPF